MRIWSTLGKLAFDALLCRSLALFKKLWRDSSGSRDKFAISSTIFVGYSSSLIFGQRVGSSQQLKHRLQDSILTILGICLQERKQSGFVLCSPSHHLVERVKRFRRVKVEDSLDPACAMLYKSLLPKSCSPRGLDCGQSEAGLGIIQIVKRILLSFRRGVACRRRGVACR